MIPKVSKTEELVSALRSISKWFDEQSAKAGEDADHWGHVIRARALDEAADRLEKVDGNFKMYFEAFNKAATRIEELEKRFQ